MIADISDSFSTIRKIRSWTGDNDNILAISYQVAGWTTFSNTVFAAQGQVAAPAVQIAWDPPGEYVRPPRGPSQHTYFDGLKLSNRDQEYQHIAVNWFIDFVLSGYLRPRRYVVEPTLAVQYALGGRLPQTLEDIAALAQADPGLLQHVQCIEGDFEPDQLSPAARQVCLRLLEDEESLARFLESPAGFIETVEAQVGSRLTAEEKLALTRAASEKPDAMRAALDSVALGRAHGDENTYILIGVDPREPVTGQRGMRWLYEQLDNFVALNHFLPAFGYFVTEARLRYRVILGPGVSDRDKRFLEFFGHEAIDMRDGSPFRVPLDPKPGTA